MKTYCKVCGVHFKPELDSTFKTPCNFWGDMGLSNLDTETKKKIWDWMFDLPSDEIYIKTGIGLAFSLKGYVPPKGTEFKDIVSNWNDLSEEEQQQFQRDYFKGKVSNSGGLPIYYGKPEEEN